MAKGSYRALLIGNWTFPNDSQNLQELEGPRNDVPLLRNALADPEAGLFRPDDVRMALQGTMAEILVELERFFSAAHRDDQLLLYYSGHGLLDENNRLYLCTRDTRTDLLKSTAVSSSAINMMIDGSAARTTIILLDCCHSGAFKGGSLPSSLRGAGRFVVTSSRGEQLANDATRLNRTSVFTQHVIDGLLSGASDADGDGYVDLGEVYSYVYRQLDAEGRQIPQRSFSGGGDVAIARRSLPAKPPSPPTPPGSEQPKLPAAAADRANAFVEPRPGRWSPRQVWVAASALMVIALVSVASVLISTSREPLTGPSPATEEPRPPPITRSVTVPGNPPQGRWIDTGIDLEAGDAVTVTATGEIDDDRRAETPPFGPDGRREPGHPGDPHPDLAHAVLLARVGESGAPFAVGSSSSFPASTNGRLYLSINDDLLDDNQGEYVATVQVNPSQ